MTSGPSAGGPGDAPWAGIGSVVFSAAQIGTRVDELGREITVDYEGRSPLLVGLLKGAFVFMSDLARAIALPVELDFMAVSSYGDATESSGAVRILKDLDCDIGGRDVIVVEDIVDSGLTLGYVRDMLAARGPASLSICSLLVRHDAAFTDVDYVGFEVGGNFLIGYGLDVGQCFRQLPYIADYA